MANRFTLELVYIQTVAIWSFVLLGVLKRWDVNALRFCSG